MSKQDKKRTRAVDYDLRESDNVDDLDDDHTFLLVVPKEDTAPSHLITSGSAVLALPNSHDSNSFLCYYEGNIYDACNLRSFHSRLQCAAGRARSRYSTSALLTSAKDDFFVLGSVLPDDSISFLPFDSFESKDLLYISKWLSIDLSSTSLPQLLLHIKTDDHLLRPKFTQKKETKDKAIQ